MTRSANVLMLALPIALVLGEPALARGTEAGSAAAITTAAATSVQPNRYVWTEPRSVEASTTVSVVVSIPDQRAYVYRGDRLIAASSVSTGKDGKETPVGSYAILQKREAHRSNLYDSAPMPFMQRLTWDGIAIHAGANPGFPASHGCIRVPTGFAKKLFAATEVGTVVAVLDTPVDDPSIMPYFDPPSANDAEGTAAANADAFASLDH
jgi:lipoprotein-anchoring transpeptidase ErfK/SrfK